MGRQAWLWLGFAVVVAALAIDLAYRHDHIGVDFHTYLAASRVGLQQGWSNIYDQRLVAIEQKALVPHMRAQPFLSPPSVAWLTAPLIPLPYAIAYSAWAVLTFGALAAALAWTGVSRGLSRWIAVVGALAPWWVMHAVNVGQVVPLVAAATVVAWRLLRDRQDVAAGLVLGLVMLKPNTAILVPLVLAVAGRYRAFAAWFGAVAAMSVIGALTIGPHGLMSYLSELRGPLPSGADDLTLHGALGVTGTAALLIRVLIIGAVLATARRLRASSNFLVPLGIVGSVLLSPYLHASDLCVLAAAAWMVWEERPAVVWRVPLAVGWALASPFLFLTGFSPRLNRWPFLEFAFLLGLAASAWLPFTAPADLRRRAPA